MSRKFHRRPGDGSAPPVVLPPKRAVIPRMALRDGDKDHATACSSCGAKPTVHPTQLCGPCCFGDSSTVDGSW